MDRLIRITAQTPAYGGISIARQDGKVVMVRGAVPGELVEARVDAQKKDYSNATVVRVLEPSPLRVEPPCPYFGDCGGCQLQYVSYEGQVGMKEEVLRDCLRRMAGLDTGLASHLTGPPWGYRRRCRFKVSRGRVGFFRERSREVVEINTCPLMTDGINDALNAARPLLRGHDVHELQVTSGDVTTGFVMAGNLSRREQEALAGSLMGAGFSGVAVGAGTKKPAAYGAGHVTFKLAELSYTVSPMSFFQTNWALNEKLVSLLPDTLGPLDGMRVADLYSGAGNFALSIAGRAKDVVAIEENPYAVADGKRNAAINGITNCRFVHADADALKDHGPFDVIVVDPPRTGLSEAAANAVLDARAGTVAYVSCDPATLARDLKRLKPAYELESVRLVDFFPQTYHIEALAVLKLL